MEPDLPGTSKIVMERLLTALKRRDDDRYRRIALLALTFLEVRHRQLFYLTQREIEAGMVLPPSDGHVSLELSRLWMEGTRVLFEVLWTMGVIRNRPWRVEAPPKTQRAKNVRLLRDRVSWEVLFPCLACGREIGLPVGMKGESHCPACGHSFVLRVNDGTRVAFAVPTAGAKPPKTARLKSVHDALTLFNASHGISTEDLRKNYRALLKKHHPDMVAAMGDPKALRIAEENTKLLNGAWELLEGRR